MANTSKVNPLAEREIYYYRQRLKNRFFEALTSFFAQEAEGRHLTKRVLAEKLKRDPAQITRWLSEPSNLTLETISDLLLGLEAEMDPQITRFADRPKANFVHPLIARILMAPVQITVEAATDDATLPEMSDSGSTKGPDVRVELLEAP